MSRYRKAVRTSVSAEARAYGFSLVAITTAYFCVKEHRLPGAFGTLCYLGGALLSQIGAAAFAFRGWRAKWSSGEEVQFRAIASVHVFSVIGGALIAWAVAAAVGPHDLAYFLASFSAFTVYQALLAAELALTMIRDG